MPKQELLPVSLRETLPALYGQEDVKDPIAHIKFFSPYNGWTWYVTEGSAEGDDFTFFGYVKGDYPEWGYFSLNELQSVKVFGCVPAVERDEHFSPTPMSQIIGKE